MRPPFVLCLFAFAAIASGQTITTIAGTPNCCTSTDGGQGTSTYLSNLAGITRDSQGNLYFWDNNKIRTLSSSGIVGTAVGSGNITASLNSGAPLTINLGLALGWSGVAMDSAGNLYISDSANHAIRVLSASTGMVTTFAGTGTFGYSGDKGPATKAQLWYPGGIAVDKAGNLYIADTSNNRIRKVDAVTGIIDTIAGSGFTSPAVTDEIPATTAYVPTPHCVAVDNAGNVYITESNRIRRVDSNGIIHLVAGQEDGSQGFSGDGGPATAALLSGPIGMALDAAGNLYFADNNNERIRRVDTSGTITTFAGKPGTASSPLGDGGPAANAYLGAIFGLVFDAAGDLILTASPSFNDIRKITPAAGSNTAGLISSPPSLTFSFTAGGTPPGSQALNVTSSGAALNFTASASTSSGNWLAIDSNGGTTPATINVSVNTAGLSAGSYPGTITLTPTGAAAIAVPVTLNVNAAGAPSITPGGIANASGYQTTLAPGVVFVIFGNDMGPAAIQGATPPDYPANLAGTSVNFTPTAGGSPIAAKVVFTSAGVIAGFLPSSAAPGTYAVAVTYNSQTSAPQNVTVAARSFGIATSNSGGWGAAQATIANVNGGLAFVRMTPGVTNYAGYQWTLTPAHPGDTVVLWGTGGGADAANDAGGTSGDQSAAGNFLVTVDGVQIKPVYAAAVAGFPGLWQINVTLPNTIAADCFASVQVSADGQLSNIVTIAIAAAGQASCSSQISSSTLSSLDGGGNVTMAGLTLSEITYYTSAGPQVSAYVGGVFNKYTAAEFLLPYSGPKVSGCSIVQETYPTGGKEPSAADAQLDAGILKFSGPEIPAETVGVIQGPTGPVYNTAVPPGSLQGGGTYTLTGAGGTQVGPFSATAVFPSSFTSNLASLTLVNHAQPLTITWSGLGFDLANILIIGDVLTSTTTQGTSVSCVVPANLGSFTVPAAALAYLPSTGTWQIEITAEPNAGGVSSAESATATALTPPLVAGGQVDFGAFTAAIVHIVTATVQ